MAVTVDQPNIGTNATTAQTNATLTTTAAVAAGGTLIWLVFRFKSGGPELYTATGGGLTWATVTNVISGNIRLHMFAAFAPAGLASSTALATTGGVGGGDNTGCAASYLGVDQSGTVAAAVRAFNSTAASTAAWSSGTLTGSLVGDAVIGGAGSDGSLLTSVIAGDNVERIDFNSAGTSGSVTLVDDLDAEVNDTAAGTWSGAQAHVALGAAFIPAGGAAPGAANTPTFAPIPFMR